ncbi:unnamed protein product [Oikopleura dioica]|uniref:ADP-ribosylation factor-like protein 6 n=1 Tax=Oikopleura dioica TaxID=34765 RepID=E4XDA1_OIKDI|nr:unnamed protein product [Oikopleura dioica]
MGFLDKILLLFGVKKPEAKVVCVGLDNSGKTTIINRLKPPKTKQKSEEIVPTVGFVSEKFQAGGLEFTVWDFSGQGRYRNMWEMYYKDAQAVIFVIDSADRLRMAVAKDELEGILKDSSIQKNNAVFLFFANKMDLADSCSEVEITQLLDLPKLLRGKTYNIVTSNAIEEDINKTGIIEGIAWLAGHMKDRESN